MPIFIAVGAVWIGGLVAGVAGFALAPIAGAILLHWFTPTTTVPLLLVCGLATQLMSIGYLRKSMTWRRSIPFVIGGLVGIPLGARILQQIDPRAFSILFALVLVCFSACLLLRTPRVAPKAGQTPWSDTAAGFAGGIMAGSLALPGIVPTLWCTIRGETKDDQRGVMQPYIFVMQLTTLAYFAKLGVLSRADSSLSLACIPAVLIGTWLGLRLFQKIGHAAFQRVVLLALLFSGAIMLV